MDWDYSEGAKGSGLCVRLVNELRIFILLFLFLLGSFSTYMAESLDEEKKSFSFSIGENYQTDVENVFGNLDSFRMHKSLENSKEFSENLLMNEMVGYYDSDLLPSRKNFLKKWKSLITGNYKKGMLYASMKGGLDKELGIPYLEFSNKERLLLNELFEEEGSSDLRLTIFLDVCLSRSTFYHEKKEENQDSDLEQNIEIKKIDKRYSVILSSNHEGKCFLDPEQSGSPFTNLILNRLTQNTKKNYSFQNLIRDTKKAWEEFQSKKGFTKPYEFFVWNANDKTVLLENKIHSSLLRLIPYSNQVSNYLSSILYDENKERYYQILYYNLGGRLKTHSEEGLSEIYHARRDKFWIAKEFLDKGEANRFFGWREKKLEEIYSLEHIYEDKYTESEYTRKQDKVILKRHSEGLNLLKNGISWIEYKLSQGLLILKSYIIKDDTYGKDKTGISMTRYNYDEMGNLLSEEFFDSRKKLIENENKIAKYFYEYGTTGNLDAKRLYNKSETYISHNPAKTIYKYDAEGRIKTEDFLNKQEKPFVNEQGIQSIEYSYHENGKINEIKYYGAGGSIFKNGIAIIAHHYDHKDNLIRKEFFNAWKKRISDEEGISIYKYSYNSENLIISEDFYNSEEEEVSHPQGYHKILYSYHKNKILEKKEYFNLKGTPVADKSGIFRTVYWYDNLNTLRGKEYYNISGYLIDAKYERDFPNVLNPQSKDALRIEFDKFYRPINLKFFDFSKFIGGSE